MEIKNVYIVDGKEFSNEEDALYFKQLQTARESYHLAAKEYESILNNCSCKDLDFVREVRGDYGKDYQDEFDNFHKESILIKEYRCNCCGKTWDYGDFGGKGDSWWDSGTIFVKTGIF